MASRLWNWVKGQLGSRAAEIDEEMEFHISMRAADSDRRRSILRFGSRERIREEIFDISPWTRLSSVVQDFRYALCVHAKSPQSTAVIVLSLAVAIGTGTAIFSFVDAIIFRLPAIEDPLDLVRIVRLQTEDRMVGLSHPDYLNVIEGGREFAGVTAFAAGAVSLRTNDQVEPLQAVIASPNYFEVLGVQPLIGRALDPARDSVTGNAPFIVLSHKSWSRRFAGDLQVIGKVMVLNGRPYTIVGVMPETFTGTDTGFTPALWMPLAMAEQVRGKGILTDRDKTWLSVRGRLNAGITIGQAHSGIAAIAQVIDREYRKPGADPRIFAALPEREARQRQDRTFSFFASMLLAVSAVVLLIACLNASALLLARGEQRASELAMRITLGASRGRVLRQLFCESLLLAVAGGFLGMIVANWCIHWLASYQLPLNVPLQIDARLDARVMTFIGIATFMASLLFGLWPAFRASRTNLAVSIRRATTGARISRFISAKNLFVFGQIVSAIVLLVSAGLFVGGLRLATQIDPGFESGHAMYAFTDLELAGLDEQAGRQFYPRVRDALGRLAGVVSAGLGDEIPLGDLGSRTSVYVDGLKDSVRALSASVDGGYFDAMGVKLLHGRSFTETDTASSQPVAIVNRTMERTFWPAGAIGGRFRFGELGNPEHMIVGVVEDGKYVTLADGPEPHFWLAFQQHYRPSMFTVIRTIGNPNEYREAVLREFTRLAPALPLLRLKTLEEHMAIPYLEPQIPMFFLTILASIGVALAATGVFATVSYWVSCSRREYGIRLALGADARRLVGTVAGRGIRLAAAAMITGLLLSLAVSQLLRSALHGLSPWNPLVYLTATFFFSGIVVMACLVPSIRAARVDPVECLRNS